ncbi:MAG: hypothetical protein KDA84_08440 [Planctomycetaceae bacterium]|nr:hypothetical protein [Planctomycetaceae bacterium]
MEDEDDYPVLVERSELRYQSHVAEGSKPPVLPYRLIYLTLAWSLVFGIPIFAIYMAAVFHFYLFLIVAILS